MSSAYCPRLSGRRREGDGLEDLKAGRSEGLGNRRDSGDEDSGLRGRARNMGLG